MNTRNSTNVCWIDTSLHRCTQMEEDVSYHAEDMRQGRDCLTPVGRYSILAGKPLRSEYDNTVRAAVWAFYLATLLTAACAVVLAYWPN